MKKQKTILLLITFVLLILSSCQRVTATPPLTQPVVTITATLQPATETSTLIPTLIPVHPKALAGLVISSPVLGTPHEVPGMRPSEMITPNGLGIINDEGQLIQFSDAGVFAGFSPSGTQIVYQHGFEDETTDRIDNLFLYNVVTEKTTEILDDLEEEGGKTILAWLQDEQKFIYYNDYFTVLFEAYGYFDPRQLLLADVATGRTRLLIEGYQFDISPDQRQIAYTTGKILDAKTSDEQSWETFGCFQPYLYNLASFSSRSFDVSWLGEKPVCMGYPQWSPDGQEIAWIGYFEDDTFRPIIFDLRNKTGKIFAALDQTPESSLMPTRWFFGESYLEDYSDPYWIDNISFWTPSYEVNVETDETSPPRKIDSLYLPGKDEAIKSPNGLFVVSLNEDRDVIVLRDASKKILASFPIADLYKGPKLEILTSPFVLPGITHLVDWSPFIPPSNPGNR